ncbi:MAG: putative metal-binding motif-containing protein, partial [Myxococcota bacterium]|nr:putative metal-binding motif-containing protein [Myxococcota bacterium]
GERSPCEDTCTPLNTPTFANNGVCEDGGPNAIYSICDVGTDCSDCGSYPLSEPIDSDGDGFPENLDCDDSNPSINPDAVELPGNGIDENCDGIDGSTQSGLCDDSCYYSQDNVCDDGGAGASFGLCDFGTDCTDCGIRNPCEDICSPWNTAAYANNGICEDGGPNAIYSICDVGTDCTDCGSY